MPGEDQYTADDEQGKLQANDSQLRSSEPPPEAHADSIALERVALGTLLSAGLALHANDPVDGLPLDRLIGGDVHDAGACRKHPLREQLPWPASRAHGRLCGRRM